MKMSHCFDILIHLQNICIREFKLEIKSRAHSNGLVKVITAGGDVVSPPKGPEGSPDRDCVEV